MKLVYTAEALRSLREALEIVKPNVSREKLKQIRKQILNKADSLTKNPKKGMKEEYLEHLDQGHRRIIEGNYKIVYIIQKDRIIVTDIFDCRQDPHKMRG